jgi:ankyrin repeat protein
LKIINDYKAKMMRLCDNDKLFDIRNVLLHEFEKWADALASDTLDETLHITEPEAISNSSYRAVISAALRAIAVNQFDSVRNMAKIQRLADSGNIGISYLLCTKLCVNHSAKLMDLKDRYQQKLLSIFEQAGKDVEVPQTILDSPLPFPVMLMGEWNLEEIGKFIQTGWTVDCLGRSLHHVILETAHVWHSQWHGIFQTILSLMPDLVNSKDLFGRTALHVACEQGHYSAVFELLNRNINVRAETGLGLQALHIAAANGHTRVCDLLLRSKDVDATAAEMNSQWSPLSFAARNGHNEVVQLLVLAEHNNLFINHRDWIERTPFHLAVIGQHLGVLKILSFHPKLDKETCDENGRPVLLDAVDDKFSEGFRYLLEICGMNPNCNDIEEENTPLILATKGEMIEIVEILVKDERTWLFARNNNNETAFEIVEDLKIEAILESTTEDRWGQDQNVMIERVMMWPKAQGFVDAGNGVIVKLVLGNLDLTIMQDLMHFFEKRGRSGWADANAQDWKDVEEEMEDVIVDYLDGLNLRT